MLTQAGLSDTQVSQVMDIQKKTVTTVRQDKVHIRLLKAQMAVALLPANVDMPALNNLITQEAQTRADIQKALIGAKVQLRQIMGDETFRKYIRHLGTMHRHHFRGWGRSFGNERMPQEKWQQKDGDQQQGS